VGREGCKGREAQGQTTGMLRHTRISTLVRGSSFRQTAVVCSDGGLQVELAETLVKNAIIAVPPQTWNIDLADAQDADRDPSEEELLVFRLGFIFLAYRIDYWWWESVEASACESTHCQDLACCRTSAAFSRLVTK
jgi:hypothetical protein